MPTIKEVKMQLRHKEWAEQITECQSSGMSIREDTQGTGGYKQRRSIGSPHSTAATQAQTQAKDGFFCFAFSDRILLRIPSAEHR